MRIRTFILGAIVIAVLVWLLYPAKQHRGVAATADVVEIVFLSKGGPATGTYADAIGEFERLSEQRHAKDPSQPIYRVITGQNATQDQTADPTRFLISVAGGFPPDVIYFDRGNISSWAYRGTFTPLDDYINRDLAAGKTDVPVESDFYSACWDEAVWDGRIYAIPDGVDDRLLFYNKDLLKRAGFVDEKGEACPPRDWDELKEYAVKLTDRSQGRIKTLGFAPVYGNSFLYLYTWMLGGSFMSADGRTCTLNNSFAVQALQYILDVYDAVGGYAEVNGFQAGFQTGALDPFIQGKLAMKIDGYWTLLPIAQYGKDLNFGVAPPPLPHSAIEKGVKPFSWCGGWSFAIPSNARQKDAAWELVKYMASWKVRRILNDGGRELAEAQGQQYLPYQAAQSKHNEKQFEEYVYNNPRISKSVKDACRTFNDLLDGSYYRPVTPVGQLLWNEHLDAVDQALYHKKSPKEALDYSTGAVQRDLDRVLAPPQGATLNWAWFLAGYVVLLFVMGVATYFWDTRAGFQKFVRAALRFKNRQPQILLASRGSYARRQWRAGVLCAAPWILGFIVFGGGPLLFSLVISFCDYDILNPPRYIGAQNYSWMFTQDDLLPKALWNTLYMVIAVPLGMAVSLALALLLNVKVRGIAVWRTLFYLPSIVPMVASSILWIWILNPQGGLVNQFLKLVGIEGPLWIQSPAWSKPSLILMGLWGAGGGMIIWLAGLKGISEQLYEAASIDGANTWQRFRYITLPQLTPYIFFNLVMGLIGTFQIFGQALIMTQGGPVNSTLFYVYHLFNNAFRYGHMGYAAAMAWVLFAIVLVLTIIQFRLARKWVYYESE